MKRFCKHGSYPDYYVDRYKGVMADPRLKLLEETGNVQRLFTGKKVLDIGCNAGDLTHAVAMKYDPASVLGIDVDASLVRRALKKARWCDATPAEQACGDLSTLADPLTLGGEPAAAGEHTVHEVGTPKLGFRKEDFSLHMHGDCAYDTIMALSVTKWVHLERGDEGMKFFFEKVHALLKRGGLFLMEPQPWSSYSKNKNTSETSSTNYKSLRLRPTDFTAILLEEVGFRECWHLGTPSGRASCQGKGFDRPLHIFMR
ncbi:unnamed protein product [Chrysoparadoxa australica]